jgi:hypothetical protein
MMNLIGKEIDLRPGDTSFGEPTFDGSKVFFDRSEDCVGDLVACQWTDYEYCDLVTGDTVVWPAKHVVEFGVSPSSYCGIG